MQGRANDADDRRDDERMGANLNRDTPRDLTPMRIAVPLIGVGGEEGRHHELRGAVEAENQCRRDSRFRPEEGDRQREAHITDIAIASGSPL